MYIIGKRVLPLKWHHPNNQPPYNTLFSRGRGGVLVIKPTNHRNVFQETPLTSSKTSGISSTSPSEICQKIHGFFLQRCWRYGIWLIISKKTTDRKQHHVEQKHKVQVFARYHFQWMPCLLVMLKVSTFAFEGRFVVVVMRSIQHQTCCIANQVSQSSTCWNPENLHHMHGNHHVASWGASTIFQWSILLYSYAIILRYLSKKIWVMLDWQFIIHDGCEA